MGRETYVLFGLVAAIGLFVAAVRSIALRGYRRLLDRGATLDPNTAALGTVGGRRAEIGFTSAEVARQPARVLVGVECATPIRLEAHTRSLATAARTTLGIYRESATGIDELDRRYVFLSLEPDAKRMLAQDSVRRALLTLADRGAEHVLLTNGWLTAKIPMTFIVPPSRGQVSEALGALTALAAGAESDARGTVSGEPAWPASRTTDAAIMGPARIAAFFLAMTFAFLIVGPLWDFRSRVPSAMRLLIAQARLPILGLLATTGGFLTSLVAQRRPALWALELTWPLIVHAMIAGAIYVLLLVSGVPEIREALSGELEAIPAGTRTAGLAAVIGFGGGFVGALVARRFDRNSEEP